MYMKGISYAFIFRLGYRLLIGASQELIFSRSGIAIAAAAEYNLPRLRDLPEQCSPVYSIAGANFTEFCLL
jgi:hypothetical protein